MRSPRGTDDRAGELDGGLDRYHIVLGVNSLHTASVLCCVVKRGTKDSLLIEYVMGVVLSLSRILASESTACLSYRSRDFKKCSNRALFSRLWWLCGL